MHSSATTSSGPRQQRRQVGVLFLDIVGSTAMTRELDPEDVQEVMDGALLRFIEVVQVHGGTVLQYAGDSILAAFGTPWAREDDAEAGRASPRRVLKEWVAALEGGGQGSRFPKASPHAGLRLRPTLSESKPESP